MQHKDEEDPNKLIEEEFQRRYKTRNLFKPNAGPPYRLSEIEKRARELKRRKIIRKPKTEVSKGNGTYKNNTPTCENQETKKPDFTEPELPIIKPVPKSRKKKESEEIPLIDKKEVPELLEDKIKTTPLEVSEPYEQGDNIYRELLTYFHSNKLCGGDVIPVLEEDGNCILSTIGAAYGLSIIVQGRSRSGKSLILDELSSILTSVYKLKVCSNKSLFGSADTINENDFLYISEYQAALDGNPAVKEAIKLITENKDATNDTNGNIQRLSGHLTVLTTGADENKKIQNMDVEVAGRFINLKTSSSPEKTKRICEYQDGLEMGVIKDIEFSKKRYDRLKQHIMNVIDDKNTSFEDPFAKAFAKFLPETQKSVYYRTLYKSLMKASAKFDRPN
ncbi:hypothetical protein KY342_06515, partial [Candidatus Woesearchaeota archaeon]|nr:hypothetical protein [Candidatus Woesearchaeota archaeon]